MSGCDGCGGPGIDPSGGAGGDGKVLVNGADTTPAYLGAKLANGTGISLAVLNPGGNEQVQITATGAPPTGAAGGDLQGTYPNPTFGKLDSLYNIATAALTTGTSQPLSINDATMTGLVADGSAVGTTGTLGVVAHTFVSAAAEQNTGAAQGGLGSAAASGQPLNTADFPGQHYSCILFKANGERVVLGDIAPLSLTDIDSPIYAYIDFRSDLGANLKWRLWFYYIAQATGLETPVTPTQSLSNVSLLVPQVVASTDVPTAAGLGIPTSTNGAVVGAAQGQFLLMAASFWLALTNGATSVSQTETTTNKINTFQVNCINGSQGNFAADFILPADYNGGTITAQFVWLAASASANSVVWGVQGIAYAAGDTFDSALGTAVETTDANRGNNLVNISAVSGPVTLAGAPKARQHCQLRVYRKGSGADNLAVSAAFIGVRISYTKD